MERRTQWQKKINTGTLLIEESTFLPESLRFESEPPSKGRRLVQDLDGCGLVRRIRAAGRSLFYVAGRPQIGWLLFLCLVTVLAGASAETGTPVPTLETILARMAQARAENRARFRPYTVRRDYTLFGIERDKTKSQVIADVTFVPPDFKKYAIQQSSGTGLGEKIVRRMLEREVEVAKDYGATDISPDNYAFRLLRQEEVSGQHCYVLELLPRRKDKNLLRGNIWVDASTYLLRRTEGKPAKSPSWWLRDVRIAFVYGDVGGMWLQTASEATTNVRILGQHTMVSRDLNYQISELVAAGSSAPRRF
jgi:Outer membrane lipoprotein-sorting protein